MIERLAFAQHMGLLAVQLQRTADKLMLDAYYLALRDETNETELAAFIGVAAKRYRWEFFPSVPKLLEALEEFRGSARVGAERQIERGAVTSERLSPTSCLAQIRLRAIAEGLVGIDDPAPGGDA